MSEVPKKPMFLTGPPDRQPVAKAEPTPQDVAAAVAPVMKASSTAMPDRPQMLQRLESTMEELQLLHLLVHDTDAVLLKLPQMPRSSWFPTPHHQRLYLGWKALYESGLPVTPDAVVRTLREQARPDELDVLQVAFERVMQVQVTDAPENLAVAVRNAAQARRFHGMLNALNQGFHQNQPMEELWERAGAELAQAEDHESFRPFQEQLLLTLENILRPDLSQLGLLTKLDQIDIMCGGLEPSQMYTFAGMSGSGKTALYLEIVMRLMVAYPDVAVCILSLEMPQRSLQQRQIANLSYVSVRRMRDHAKPGQVPLTEAEAERIGEAVSRMQEWGDRLEMHFRSATCDDMRDIARKFALKHRGKRKVFIADHLGLVTGKSNDIRANTIEAVKTMKAISTDHDYATIPLVQMVKELESKRLYASTYHRPDQSFIAESGFIQQTADVILCTWRPEAYTAEMEIELDGVTHHNFETKNKMILVSGKNREGAPNQQLLMGCHMEFMQIYNIGEQQKYNLGLPVT